MKKTVAIILSLALIVLALAGCGDSAYNVPIICGETGMNDVCGVATYGVDYYNLGIKAGDMAAEILLKGKNPGEIPVATDPNPALSINKKVAEDIGFEIPDSVSLKATDADAPEVTRATDAIVEDGADFTVGILQLVQHVALDAANKGFQDELSVKMKEAGKTVKFLDQNASNDQSNNTTIANSFVAQNVNLIYTIATSSSQAAVEATKENPIPVIFNAVTNPVDSGLVASFEAPGSNVTGVSDINPVADQVDLIAELIGKDDVKIGFLYTSAEANSVFQIGLGVDECKAKGFEFVEKGIGDINDIESAFVSLKAAGVDAIYIPTDNTLANGAAAIHSLNVGE